MQLPPEKLLLRWFNHHLREAGVSRECTNFGPDVRDCELYAYLLQQIDPEHKISSRTILAVAEPAARAAHVAAVGPRLGAEFTVQPADIISGNEKLNMAFVAALFNACPALDPPEEEQVCPCHLLPPPTSHLPPPTLLHVLPHLKFSLRPARFGSSDPRADGGASRRRRW